MDPGVDVIGKSFRLAAVGITLGPPVLAVLEDDDNLPMDMRSQPRIWVLADGRPGNTHQALGVAEALGLPADVKTVSYSLLAQLPNLLRGATLAGVTPETRQKLAPPWPDLVIAAGRRLGPVARWIKAEAASDGGDVFLCHIMHPGETGVRDFDLVVVPGHDRQDNPFKPLNRPNVMRVTGAPHRLTTEKLEDAATSNRDRFDGVPKPLVAVLLGGATKHGDFSLEEGAAFGAMVQAAVAPIGGTVLLATSRRTSPELADAVERELKGEVMVTRYGQDAENLYLPFLASADAVIVTGDSVSMVSEACATSAPVYIFAPKHAAAPKFLRLHKELFDNGYARSFDGRIDDWSHAPLNPAVDIADAIRAKLPAFLDQA